MIVVGMVGVMAALAVPSLSSSSRRASAPVQMMRVHGFMTSARNLARRTNRCVKVERATDGDVLTLSTFSTCTLTEVCQCRASNLPNESRTLSMAASQPSDARVTTFAGNSTTALGTEHANDDTIVFFADGSTPYAGLATVDVNFPDPLGAMVRRLTVMPATGVVRLVVAGE